MLFPVRLKKKVKKFTQELNSYPHSHRGVKLFEEKNDHWNECPNYNLNAYLK